MICLGEETGKTMQTYRESMNTTYRRETEALLSVKGRESREAKSQVKTAKRDKLFFLASPLPYPLRKA